MSRRVDRHAQGPLAGLDRADLACDDAADTLYPAVRHHRAHAGPALLVERPLGNGHVWIDPDIRMGDEEKLRTLVIPFLNLGYDIQITSLTACLRHQCLSSVPE